MPMQENPQAPSTEAPKFPAIWTVHCPQGPTNTCEEHRFKLQALMRFMGTHVIAVDAPEGASCKNCENEHAAGKR